MQLGPRQIQIFTSLVPILGAASAALICDLLRWNNEQLRGLVIEQQVRREEEQKRSQTPVPRETSARALATPALAIPEDKKRTIAPEALAVMERGAQLAGASRTPPATR